MNDFSNSISKIIAKILAYKTAGKRVFATSSFQTQSVVLLDIISKNDLYVPIYFLNTGYHFPETIEYKLGLTKQLHLNVIDLPPIISKFQQRDAKNQLLYVSDPDRCCYYNKVQALENIFKKFDVWISGVRREQTAVRAGMKEEEQPLEHDIIRFHPMLDWTTEMLENYIDLFNLPRHPLAPSVSGVSVGCEPCTILPEGEESDKARNSRWLGLKKTECGLHTDLRSEK